MCAAERQKTFCGFSMGSNQYWAGRVYDICVYYMTGAPEGSPKVVLCALLKDIGDPMVLT